MILYYLLFAWGLIGLIAFFYLLKEPAPYGKHIKEDSKYFLIDGQHRYEAIKKLANSGYNEHIFIEVILVKSIESIKENYNTINQNTPLPDFSYEVSTEILNDCLKLFQDKYEFYDEIFSSSTKCKRPKISRNRFEEALEFIVFKLLYSFHGFFCCLS